LHSLRSAGYAERVSDVRLLKRIEHQKQTAKVKSSRPLAKEVAFAVWFLIRRPSPLERFQMWSLKTKVDARVLVFRYAKNSLPGTCDRFLAA
jgi:hypothetical protein